MPELDLGNVKGPQGKSAYQSALDAGYSGSEEAFNTAMAKAPDAVLYTVQSLTDAQKAQARGNINAANGTFKTVHLDKIGWYRIATCRSSGGGILSLQHGWGSGGPSSLKFLVTMDVYTPALKCIDTDCFQPQFTNARLVTVAENFTAIDVYYNVAYDNSPVICFIQTGQNSVAIQEPSYISDSDTLPDRETLLLPMEYLNPPMKLGIEYRTTERYLGKPVYVKALSISPLPNNSNTSVNIAANSDGSADETIRAITAYGVTSNGNAIPAWAWSRDPAKKIYLQLYLWIVYLKTTFDASGENATIVVKYTKTTD